MNEEAKPTGQANNSGGRNINTGGGMYNEGTIHNSGGVNVSGGHIEGGITYTDNRITASDAAKLDELLKALHQQIDTAPATTPEEVSAKADAKEAADGLKGEIEAVKKNPDHKPNKFTMQGFVAAFKKLGAPVFGAAMTVIGYPALGLAVNQFAQALPDGSDKA